MIRGILPGVKHFSGEKIQWSLASELRDRIRQSGVRIKVVDRTARAEYSVEPRQFEGRLLHELADLFAGSSELYAELYLIAHSPRNVVSLDRAGTRVLADVAEIDAFARSPWSSGYIPGIVDAPYLNLTPGTRLGVLHDAALERMREDLAPLEVRLAKIVEDQQRAEEERASRDVLRSVQGAIREALLALPAEEYDWFDLARGQRNQKPRSIARPDDQDDPEVVDGARTRPEHAESDDAEPQRQFFEFAGPLSTVVISPMSSVVPVSGTRNLRAIPRDRARRTVERDVAFAWTIVEGEGQLESAASEYVCFHAPAEPGLTRVQVTVAQADVVCTAQAQITVTASLASKSGNGDTSFQGLPGYTYQKAAGELWRSRFDSERNLVVVNNGHRDFVYAARNKMLKLRYITRLYAKELVLKNFIGIPADEMLERLLELTLYTEENLR